MHALSNGLTVWCNINLKVSIIDTFEFRFQIIRIWYAEFKKHNAMLEVLYYPRRQPKTEQNHVNTVLLSPQKGMRNYAIFIDLIVISAVCSQRYETYCTHTHLAKHVAFCTGLNLFTPFSDNIAPESMFFHFLVHHWIP